MSTNLFLFIVLGCFTFKSVIAQQFPSENRVAEITTAYEEARNQSAEEAEKIALQMEALLDSVSDPLQKGKLSLAIATSYYDKRNIQQSIDILKQALSNFEIVNDQEGISDVYSDMGLNYYSLNNFELSSEYYIKAIKIREKLNDIQKLGESYLRLSFLLTQQNQFKEAVDYLTKALSISKEMKDTVEVIKTSFNLANLYKRMMNSEVAYQYLDTTENLARSIGMDYGVAKALGMRAYVLIDDKKLDDALQSINKAQIIYEKMGIVPEVFQMEIARARVYQDLKNYNLMLSAANSAKQLDEGIEDFELLKELHEVLYIANKFTGNMTAALEAHEQFTAVNDSIFSVENATKINELITKYETEKKEAEIVELTQKAEIQSLELRQKNLFLLLIGGFTLLTFIIGYVVYRQRSAVAEAKTIELEQRFLRSQLNPHFIYNALGAIQNFMLKNSAQEAGIYLGKFGKLMRQILENSREEFIPLAEEVKMLENYMQVHQLQMNNSFEYKIEISDELDPEYEAIPPMFIQPFVENAIEHGIVSAKNQGQISIKLTKAEELISISVQDNGAGLSQIKTKEHKSLATTIINERIEAFNKGLKKKIKFEIEEVKGQDGNIIGTQVQLKVPFKYV